VIQPLLIHVQESLPLTITHASWSGDALQLYGQDWSFNSPSVWRLVKDGLVHCACYDERASDALAELVGVQIVRVTAQSEKTPVDPVFHLSTGIAIEVFSTDTFEPWVMRLPDASIWVAAPGDRDPFTE